MKKMAIIGTGGHSKTFHGEPCTLLSGRVDCAAVCSLNLQEAQHYAKQTGFRECYNDADEMIRVVNPDALMVVTPVEVNYEMARRLIPLGIPLLLEKPPGRTAAEAAELVRLADAHGTSVTLSFNRIFSPPLVQMQQWLAAHTEIRTACHLRATMLRANRIEPEFINATAIHSLDVILALMGEPLAVEAHFASHGGGTLNTRMTFSGGASAGFDLNPVSGLDEEVYEIIAADCYLRADLQRGTFEAWQRGTLTEQSRIPEDATAGERAGASNEIESFIRTLETGRAPYPDLRHGWAVMNLADYLQAVRTGVAARFQPVLRL